MTWCAQFPGYTVNVSVTLHSISNVWGFFLGGGQSVYLKGREKERALLTPAPLPKYPQQPRMGREPGIQAGSPLGILDPNYLHHHQLLPGDTVAASWNLGLEIASPKQCPNHCAKPPSSNFYFLVDM